MLLRNRRRGVRRLSSSAQRPQLRTCLVYCANTAAARLRSTTAQQPWDLEPRTATIF
jgi:hypothetical protein